MTDSNQGSPAWVTDILEFGHNIGLVLALAGFGAVAFYVEPVGGLENWNRSLAMICLLVAAAWGAISGSHFSSQIVRHTRIKRRSLTNVFIGGFCIAIGSSVVLLAPVIPDNNHIVSLCDKYAEKPSDQIHQAKECQRLYARRADYERRLRGE